MEENIRCYACNTIFKKKESICGELIIGGIRMDVNHNLEDAYYSGDSSNYSHRIINNTKIKKVYICPKCGTLKVDIDE